jgi:hypothetical protein
MFLTEAVQWFVSRDIPLFSVNENPEQVFTKSAKVYADVYIDDCGVALPWAYPAGWARGCADWIDIDLLVQRRTPVNILKEGDDLITMKCSNPGNVAWIGVKEEQEKSYEKETEQSKQPVDTGVQIDIAKVFDNCRDMVLAKNRKYGNSALEPIHIFNKTEAVNSILIRLDDKLQRIKNNKERILFNDVSDLMGYLALYCVSQGWFNFQDLVD